jgi:hypothetical protein
VVLDECGCGSCCVVVDHNPDSDHCHDIALGCGYDLIGAARVAVVGVRKPHRGCGYVTDYMRHDEKVGKAQAR